MRASTLRWARVVVIAATATFARACIVPSDLDSLSSGSPVKQHHGSGGDTGADASAGSGAVFQSGGAGNGGAGNGGAGNGGAGGIGAGGAEPTDGGDVSCTNKR